MSMQLAWGPEGAIRRAWEELKRSWRPIVGACVVLGAATKVPGIVMDVFVGTGMVDPNSGTASAMGALTLIITWLADAFFTIGIIRLSLAIVRQQPAPFRLVISGADRMLPFLTLTIVQGIVVGLGFLLLFLPGVLLSLGLMLAPFYVVDRGMGPIAAMKASWAATEGQKTQLAILYVSVFFVLAGVGLFACLVWSVVPFVAPALWALITAIVYTRLVGQSSAQQDHPEYPLNPLLPSQPCLPQEPPAPPKPPPPNGPWGPDWP
ncbi:hypothetical protein [Pendulispora albinea]|uniref:Glycerophosphoryl diester phosphodiesterase membrane domain-containing protein n=1 Tax=Pendulispora albinea TaxID=2741071 RepID=A0ABZ2M8Y6_9BACT